MAENDPFQVLVIGARESVKTPRILTEWIIMPGRVDARCRYHRPTHRSGLEEGKTTGSLVLIGCVATDMDP